MAGSPGGSPPVLASSTSLLTPQDRIVRKPLAPWAGRLVEMLEKGRKTIRTTRGMASGVSDVANLAALIAAHRGNAQAAWRLTKRQVWWHGRQARRSGDSAVVAYCVQPWINLGRLEALGGRLREALARFAGLATYAMVEQLELGCVAVREGSWSSVYPTREEFLQFLEMVYFGDSLKAMLLNRRFDLVPAFAARYVGGGGLRCICQEACVVAECRTGAFDTAMERAWAAASEAHGWNRAVLRLRMAEAAACAGETDRASEILGQLSGVVRQLSAGRMADPRLMPITARLAVACHEIGLATDAYAVARDVLEGARTVNDEPVQIEMLRLLAATAPDEEHEAWSDAARAAEESTDYARYRRGGPRPNPIFDELYERLEEVYAN